MHPTAIAINRSVLLLLFFALAAWLSTFPFYSSPSPVVHGPVLLADPQGTLTPRQALEQAANGNASTASLTPVYWWVAEVQNPTDASGWVVHVGNTAVERAQLFVFDGATLVHHDEVDRLAQSAAGETEYAIGHQFTFSLPTASHQTVAVRLESAVPYKGLVFIKPAQVAHAEARFHMVAIWTSAGAIAALIGYNLFLGLSLRLGAYLYYVGHASGHLIYLLTALGMLGATLPILERYQLVNIPGIGIGVFCGALFVYSFLELKTLAPRLAAVFRAFMIAMLASPLLALFLEPQQFFTAIRSSHLLLAILVLTAALTAAAKQKREARYILVGWGGMVAMTTKGMLGVMGIVELSIDAGVWALWAILFEMFFLSLALADRVRRLNREKEAAQAANAAKSAFLANMSHEIRTPLNGVLGMVDVLRRTSLDTTQHQYLDNIRQCSTTLLGMLNNVLDYSRAEAGRIKLETTDFAPRRLLDEVIFLLRPQAEQKGLHLHLTMDGNVPEILQGDSGRLRQILLNLIGNAVKFTEQGEVHLQVAHLGADAVGHRLRFSVTDTGIGMAPEAVQHLFHRFHQADSSIARRYGGTGLGLAIAKELVTLMGGAIEVDTRPGQGSQFRFELVLPAGKPPGEDFTEKIQLPALKILVVDDDDINRLVVSELLSRDGHKVTPAASGAAALASAGQQTFDVILMDLAMPGMDGMETTRGLRSKGVNVPVIGLTAHILPEQEAACVASGMYAVVNKPIHPGKLQRLIAAALERNYAKPHTVEQ